MNKILSLLLVCGMSALVHGAAVINVITPSGTNEVSPSDVVVIQIGDTGGFFGGYTNAQIDVTAADGGAWEANAASGLTANNGAVAADGNGGETLKVSTFYFGTHPTIELIGSYTFHVPELAESSTIDIAASGNWGAGAVAPIIASLHVVPEPMTMTLLGLGGLVAARRRRA